MINDLFFQKNSIVPLQHDGAFYLPQACIDSADDLIEQALLLLQQQPAVSLTTPMGAMSSHLSNAGDWGWHSDSHGYRYEKAHPHTGSPWPSIPPAFTATAQRLAARVGYLAFSPNSCVLNVYSPSSKMGLHRDADENDTTQPIVSVSLGLSARFQFGGPHRANTKQTLELHHGDAVVWGGPSRLNYHGIQRVLPNTQTKYTDWRLNLTFRFVNRP